MAANEKGDEDDGEETFGSGKISGPSARRTFQKKLRHINPLGMRVVVRIHPESGKTEAGLYLPESARTGMHESLLGEVMEVASAIDDETAEEANISGIPLGALVLIPKTAGVRIPWDENLRIVDTKDVLAVVEEVRMV